MKFFLTITFILLTVSTSLGEDKSCYTEDSNCREEEVNCREEPSDCKETCIQERCFDFIEEGKTCLCIKKQKTNCKSTIAVCDKTKVCDEKLICEEAPLAE